MTLPVPVEKGRDLLITRRTTDRFLFLTPHPVVNHIYRFALAHYAEKYKILLYSFVALSNHHHIACHDTEGVYPEFCRDFHSVVARAINRFLDRREAVWSPDRQNTVILYDNASLIHGISYPMGNASTSHLVERAEDWPGVLSSLSDLCSAPRTVKRPEGFFSAKNYPDVAHLQFVKPASFSDWTTDQYRAQISEHIGELCQEARNKRQREGIRVVGRLKVLEQNPYDQPKSRGESHGKKLLFACTNPVLRKALLVWLQLFRATHREARLSFEAGNTDAKFPHGTYLHRKRYGVDCSAIGPPPTEV